MIERYLTASRRTKKASDALLAEYQKFYRLITSQTTPAGDHPTLFVTYSSDRKCELISIGAKHFLIYDQYLGQSFNRLNRIQYATHGAAALSQAFACKFIAERLLCLGLPAPAAFFALTSSQFEEHARAKGNPFNVPPKIDSIRHGLTAAQELFVMAHELAHHRWLLDSKRLDTEVSQYARDFIISRKQNDISEDTPGSANYYEQILNSAPP